jgi:hypothetical protein
MAVQIRVFLTPASQETMPLHSWSLPQKNLLSCTYLIACEVSDEMGTGSAAVTAAKPSRVADNEQDRIHERVEQYEPSVQITFYSSSTSVSEKHTS